MTRVGVRVAAVLGWCIVALVSATPFEDRHQPLSAIDPNTFVDGTRSEILWHEENDADESQISRGDFSFAIQPKHPRRSGKIECEDMVTVTVTTTGSPNQTHWIASYSPGDADVTKVAPTKYAMLHEADENYLHSGVARVDFRLTCMRHDYGFVVFTNGWVTRQRWREDFTPSAVAVARSQSIELVNVKGPRAPRVVVLGKGNFESDSSETIESLSIDKQSQEPAHHSTHYPLAVAWTSGRGVESNPRLRWWFVEEKSDDNKKSSAPGREKNVHTSRASTRTYALSDLCGSPANSTGWRDPGYTHTARFVSPPNGGAVEYELVDDAGGVYPEEGKERLTLKVPWALEADGSYDMSVEELLTQERGVKGVKEELLAQEIVPSKYPFTLALFGDMGRGTDDSTATWQEYGSAAIDVSALLTKHVDVDRVDRRSFVDSIMRTTVDRNTQPIYPIDAAFLIGDLSYAVGYQSVWDEFSEQVTNWAASIPLLINAGNHEFDGTELEWQWAGRGVNSSSTQPTTRDKYGTGDSGGECGVPTGVRFPSPGSDNSKWFAATLGPFRIISINTEIEFEKGSDQFIFVERELSSVDRQKTPWVIVAGHRPALVDSSFGEEKGAFVDDERNSKKSSDYSDVGVALALQRHLWPLFVRHGVNLVVSGHNHAYQRHCAFAGEVDWDDSGITQDDSKRRKNYFTDRGCASFSVKDTFNVSVYETPTAPVSVVVGTAGGGFTKHDVGALFSEVVLYHFGYLSLSAISLTEMRGAFWGIGDEGDSENVFDEFIITQTEWKEVEDFDQGLGFEVDEVETSAKNSVYPRRAGATATT